MGQVCGVPVPCASRAEARPARGDTAKGGVPTAEPKVACVEASSATAPHEVARERSDAAVSLGRASVASSTYFSAVDWAPDDEDDAEVLWARSVARRSSRAARRPSADEAQGGSGLGRDGKQRRASGCARAASLVESEELIEAFDVAHLGSSGALDALRDARECKRVLLARTLLRRLRDDLGGAAADAALEHAGLDADEIERDADEAERCNAALDDHTGWTAVRDDTLRCWYLHDEKQGAHCIKFQCILPHPLEKAVALLHEWDLIGSWNKCAFGDRGERRWGGRAARSLARGDASQGQGVGEKSHGGAVERWSDGAREAANAVVRDVRSSGMRGRSCPLERIAGAGAGEERKDGREGRGRAEVRGRRARWGRGGGGEKRSRPPR